MRNFIKISIVASLLVMFSINAYSQGGAIKLIVSITGTILDDVTKKPIGVDIELVDESGTRVARAKSNASDGYYFITGLNPGKKYYIRNIVDITKEKRYFRTKTEINIPKTDSYQEYSKDIALKPLSNEMEIPLRVSPFSIGKSLIRSGGEQILKKFVDELKENPRVKIEVVCFPDKSDDQTNNKKLTDERAKALQDFFVANGIDAARLSSAGKGDVDPKNPPPSGPTSKGKRYKGPVYFVVRGY